MATEAVVWVPGNMPVLVPSVRGAFWLISCVALLLSTVAFGAVERPGEDLWILRPVIRPTVPDEVTSSGNPIDALVAAEYRQRGLTPVGPADKPTLLRRVYLDLIGLPPSPQEQEAFERDRSPDAYEKVVDRLLASEQYGVRYGRHWLDVLRYSDADERMTAAPGIYLWRDWVIHSLNDDLPYDQFVRAQLTGYRTAQRTQMSATGIRARVEPRPDDMFALGFLARGRVLRDGKDGQELAISAVDTVSTAFMGLTVGCAKCHDHKLDPITRRDYYAMKALFDPLVLRKVILATAEQIVASGRARDEMEQKRGAIEAPLEELIGPYRKRLYDQRVAMLPQDVRAIILKPEKQRTPAEQKIADDYFPVLRIDADKILEIMPPADREKYQALQRRLSELGSPRKSNSLPAFWTVEVDPEKATEPSYMLTSGDPDRPEKDHPVEPGWPFAPAKIDFTDGRLEAFSDWLTDNENPMFARVAVNRLWQWHFGEGLEKTPSDFGKMGGMPSNPKLLDWLASEFVRRGFSMKQMNRLIVTSDTYKLSSQVDSSRDATSIAADPADIHLWHFQLRRLDAEQVWDCIFSAAGDLDLSVGGPSFDIGPLARQRDPIFDNRPPLDERTNRRGAYLIRGYSSNRDILPEFLQTFDVDDGRVPCPLRTQTVTAPQALFMMNSAEIEKATVLFATRLENQSHGELSTAVDLAYRIALARPPSPTEATHALAYLQNDPARLKNFAWLMLNLDEFLYVK